MHENTLGSQTKKMIDVLKKQRWIADFYLAGGTALALHYGHRQSVDLDWFTEKPIRVPPLIKKISAVSSFDIRNQEENTLEGILDGVKMSFMTYPYPLLKPPVPYVGSVSIASPLDIACMKIGAVSGRNTKKDFIDLFIFLEREQMPLSTLLTWAKKKMTPAAYDQYHIYKSLIYFVEADQEPMPTMITPVAWDKIKAFFVREVKKASNTK